MVVALDDGFCGFAGFLGPDPMAALLRGCPQLQQVLGADHVREYLAACEGGDDQSQRRRQVCRVRLGGDATRAGTTPNALTQ
jgi:hypothetical protein